MLEAAPDDAILDMVRRNLFAILPIVFISSAHRVKSLKAEHVPSNKSWFHGVALVKLPMSMCSAVVQAAVTKVSISRRQSALVPQRVAVVSVGTQKSKEPDRE